MPDGSRKERCRGEESKPNMSDDGGSGNDKRRRKKSRTKRIKNV